jgi:hypothetical protein
VRQTVFPLVMTSREVSMYSNRFRSPSSRSRGRRDLAAATLALFFSFTTTGVATAASTSPGKNSAFVSSTGILTTFATKAVATIEKGKKKTVLAIEASYGDGASYPTASAMRVIGIIVRVNGVVAQPNPFASFQYYTDCGYNGDVAPVACSITGTFWFDVDAAELANPGQFVGQPLNVELTAGDLANGPLVGVTPMDASLTVRVTKK